MKVLQENAYREVILRQRINEAAKGVMVAYALDADLDQFGANNGVARLTITPADSTTIPPAAAVMESNDDYRARIAAAFEGLSVAGHAGAYEYHAKSADGRVADASAISPSPAVVTVIVLAREGDGTAAADLLAVADKALNDENVRPVADRVSVQPAACSLQKSLITKSRLKSMFTLDLKPAWQTQLLLGIINDVERMALTAWMKYIQAIQNVEISALGKVVWPEKPD